MGLYYINDFSSMWFLVSDCIQSLNLLDHLIRSGSEHVIDYARDNIHKIRVLHDFQYIDENGKDEGLNVREKSHKLIKLLNDTDAIREERKKVCLFFLCIFSCSWGRKR